MAKQKRASDQPMTIRHHHPDLTPEQRRIALAPVLLFLTALRSRSKPTGDAVKTAEGCNTL